jgi:hypothetical protein
MSKQLGSGEQLNSDDRAILLMNFRKVLVDEWPEPTSMRTILRDAGLPLSRYIIQAEKDDNRWAEALEKIDRDNKLMKLIIAVRNFYGMEKKEAIEQLYAAESAARQTGAMDAFDGLVDHLRFTTDHIKKLQTPENADLKDLAALKDRLKKLYQLLDELRTAQRAEASADDIAQVGDIEKRANMCTDALQLYLALLKFAQPPETLQIGEANVPGGLGNRASDELWLIKAKVALRNALARLAEAVQTG